MDSSPAVSNGVVYIASDDGLRLRFQRVHGQPDLESSISEHLTLFTCGRRRLRLHRLLRRLHLRFERFQRRSRFGSTRTADEVESSPAIAYGCIYVGSDDNNVYCLNASTGTKSGRAQLGTGLRLLQLLQAATSTLAPKTATSTASTPTTGAEEWSYQTGNIIESSPAIADNMLVHRFRRRQNLRLNPNQLDSHTQPSQTANLDPCHHHRL